MSNTSPIKSVASLMSSSFSGGTPSPTLSRTGNMFDNMKAGTLRPSKKGLFDMGKFAAFGSSSALSPSSATDDDNVELDIDSWVEDGYTSSTLVYVSIEFKSCNIGSVALNEVDTVEKNISVILERIEATAPHTLEQFKLSDDSNNAMNPNMFHIAKIDPRSPGILTFIPNSEQLSFVKLRDNDHLKVVHEDEVTSIAVTLPALNENTVLEYTYDVNVKDIIARLKEIFPSLNNGKYGLFWQNRGVWLEDSKKMISYVFSGREHLLELRELSEAFLLRVFIPEAETKFTIRALPSFRAVDAMRMITYQMANRGIQLESKRFGSGGQHGFYIPATNQWLSEDALLSDYPNINQTEDLHFKLQYRHVKIVLKWVRGAPKSLSAVLVEDTVTAAELAETLNTSYGQFVSNNYQLFCLSGDPVPATGTLWDLIKESGESTFIYQSKPRQISVAIYGEYDNILKFNEDYCTPIANLLPRFARAFGIKESLLAKPVLEVEGLEIAVEPKKSLQQHNVDGVNTILFLAIKPQDTEACAEAPKVLLDDLPIWDEPLEGTLVYETISSPIPTDQNSEINPSSLQNGNSFSANALAASLNLSSGNNVQSLIPSSQNGAKSLQMQVTTTGRVACGTLNRLIAHLASGTADGSVEYHDFVKTFLLTYQSFTTSGTLLRKLIERYHVPRQPDMTFEQFDALKLQIQLRVCNVIMQWIKKYTSDFTGLHGVGLCAELYQFIDDVLGYDHPFMAKKLRKLLNKLTEQTQSQLEAGGGIRKSQFSNNRFTHSSFVTASLTANSGASGVSSIISSMQSPNNLVVPATPGFPAVQPKYPKRDGDRHNIMAYPAEEIARQLTWQEFRMFIAIRPSEFLGQAWSKQDASMRSPNLIVLTRRFNAIASWVASVILDGKTPQNRAIRMAKFISVGNHLFTLNNFSTLMAIVAGINNSSVRRLKNTIKELPKSSARRLKELEIVMNAEASYKQYRTLLNSLTPPMIPYIGVALMDLTFMEDGNPDKIENKINFAKRSLVADVIRSVEQQQTTSSYNIVPIEDFQAQLAKIPDNTDTREKELYALSLEREPRETTNNTINSVPSQSNTSSPTKA